MMMKKEDKNMLLIFCFSSYSMSISLTYLLQIIEQKLQNAKMLTNNDRNDSLWGYDISQQTGQNSCKTAS
jgi:hypothetical protein